MSHVCTVTLLLLAAAAVPLSASPTVTPAAELQGRPPSPDCPSCSLPQARRNSSSPDRGQSDMVEAVKRHILNMLHLSARPNLTQPVPRAALLNAIKKLHVGRVSEDGSVEIQEDGRDAWDSPPPEPPSEIITFGEPGESSGQSQVCKVYISVARVGDVEVEGAFPREMLQVQQGETAAELHLEGSVDLC